VQAFKRIVQNINAAKVLERQQELQKGTTLPVKTQGANRKLSIQNENPTHPVVPQKFNLALAQVVEMPRNSRTIDESEAISPLMEQYRTLDKIQ
jgi:hypothetical protein